MSGGGSPSFLLPESDPGALGTQPQVQVSPQNIQVHEGDALRLYCRATGSPTPKLSWLKNGGRLPPQVRGPRRRADPGTHEVLARCCCSFVHVQPPWISILLFEMTMLTSPFCLSPPLLFWLCGPAPCLTLSLHQAIPSHGFHQFKSNSLDVLHRRIEELQVCPSVCLCCLLVQLSATHPVFAHCPLSA